MRLGELQDKDVISMEDGKLLGNIIDVNIDENGKLLSFLVARKRFFSWFFSKNEVEIRWEQIDRIGSDVILIKTTN